MKDKSNPNIGTNLYDNDFLLSLYEQMVLIRKFELTVQENYKIGEIPGFIHLCNGQEAVAVGVCSNLRKSDWITSTHRGHGHALAKGVAVERVLAELYGKVTGCNGGRGGSMHLYSYQDGLFGTNGLVGGGVPLAVGLGMSSQVKGEDGVAASFFGDGAINHGAFHESVNFAAVQKSPVVFICENNQYATCTPVSTATLNSSVSSRASAYGIPGITVDGNDVLAVFEATKDAVELARKGEGPTLIEALTYRTVGHHEGDVIAGTYRTLEELESWKDKCPILRFENYLLKLGIVSKKELDGISIQVSDRMEKAIDFARKSEYPNPVSVTEHCWKNPINPPVALEKKLEAGEMVKQGWLVAVRDGIAEEMRRDKNIMYLGEGIGERGGTFGHTKNLWKEFGSSRVIDTPICELAFTGAAASASAAGCRTIADLMFADFIFEATSQIINQASKLRYMSNGQLEVPMIIRAGSGQIKQAGPQHSGTFHSIWGHIPGLIVAVPSNPADAKGLMKTALRAGDPVIFLESKALFATKGPVPVDEHYVPFGRARIIEKGDDITIVTFGLPVFACKEAGMALKEKGISCEIIDLRTIVPLDIDTILESVRKTKLLLVVDDAYPLCSMGSEISALVSEKVFGVLKGPVGRINKTNVPQPFSPILENEVTITSEIVVGKVMKIMEQSKLKLKV